MFDYTAPADLLAGKIRRRPTNLGIKIPRRQHDQRTQQRHVHRGQQKPPGPRQRPVPPQAPGPDQQPDSHQWHLWYSQW